jgi:hypothetical protein
VQHDEQWSPQHSSPGAQHSLPHGVAPAWQRQTPPMHCSVPAHAIPQPPQLAGSAEVSMQVPPQSEVPGGQLQQWSPQQYCSGAQHSLSHGVAPAWHRQTPPTHCSVPAQGIPQPPQLLGSLMVSVHSPLQTVCPAGQPHVPSEGLHWVPVGQHDSPHCSRPSGQAARQPYSAVQIGVVGPQQDPVRAQQVDPEPQHAVKPAGPWQHELSLGQAVRSSQQVYPEL